MNLTAQNTAVVVDSTADFPEAGERFPNWRMVPLYVRFGDESYRDYVDLGPHEFYERLRTSPTTPATSQPTPGDFAATYAELAGYERIYSIHIPESLSGTIQSARVAADFRGGQRCALEGAREPPRDVQRVDALVAGERAVGRHEVLRRRLGGRRQLGRAA